MAEENQVVENQEVQETQEQVVEQPSYSEVEMRAMSMGWKPKDQFQGDEDGWVDAKEFVGRKSLFDRIEAQSRKIKDLDKAITDFRGHYQKVEATAYERAIKELKQQKRTALEEEDTRAALKFEDQIEQLTDEYEQYKVNQQAVNPPQNSPSPAFVAWIQQGNEWYAKDPALHNIADTIGMEYYQRTGASEHDVLEFVSKEVRKRFPEKFQNPARAQGSPVDGGKQRGNAPGGKTSALESKMPAEAREVMNRMVRSGLLTKEEYLKDYFG